MGGCSDGAANFFLANSLNLFNQRELVNLHDPRKEPGWKCWICSKCGEEHRSVVAFAKTICRRPRR